MKNKKLVIILTLLIIFLLVVGLVIWKSTTPPEITAVYLTTGELLFGEKVNFPNYGLKKVYTIQVDPENEENPIAIQKFSNVFWGPSDFLKINRDNVIWTVKLNSTSQLVELIMNNPDLEVPQNQPLDSSNEPDDFQL